MDEFFKAGPLKQRDLYKAALARIAELEGPAENVVEDLNGLTVAELRSRCQDADVVGYGKMKKTELIKALS